MAKHCATVQQSSDVQGETFFHHRAENDIPIWSAGTYETAYVLDIRADCGSTQSALAVPSLETCETELAAATNLCRFNSR